MVRAFNRGVSQECTPGIQSRSFTGVGSGHPRDRRSLTCLGTLSITYLGTITSRPGFCPGYNLTSPWYEWSSCVVLADPASFYAWREMHYSATPSPRRWYFGPWVSTQALFWLMKVILSYDLKFTFTTGFNNRLSTDQLSDRPTIRSSDRPTIRSTHRSSDQPTKYPTDRLTNYRFGNKRSY